MQPVSVADLTAADAATRVFPALRAQGPTYIEALDAWLLTDYASVDLAARTATLVRGTESFMSPAEQAQARRARGWHDMPNHEAFVQFSLLETDGAVHERLRRLLLKSFSRSQVARHRAFISARIDGLLDELLPRARFDFVTDFAAQLPGLIIGALLGVPEQDAGQLRQWSGDIVQFFDVDRTAQHKALAEQSTAAFADYLREHIAARDQQPRQDLLSTLVHHRNAGHLSEQELLSTAMLILMAGHGSTIDVLGTGLKNLLLHPAELKSLRAKPELIATAAQEMFRFESPLPYFHRYAAHDLTLFGHRWPAGTRFGLLYSAANHDPDAFPEPQRFRVDRAPNRHLAFGRGAHLCLGNQLARLGLQLLLQRLLARTRRIHLATETFSYRPGLTARGLTSLPIDVEPAS